MVMLLIRFRRFLHLKILLVAATKENAAQDKYGAVVLRVVRKISASPQAATPQPSARQTLMVDSQELSKD